MNKVIEKPNQGENPYLMLSLKELRERKSRIEAELNDVKNVASEIDNAIRAKVEREIGLKRQYERKHEGTVRVIIDGVEVVSNVPKRVVWDSELLDELCTTLEYEGYNPEEWLECKYSIPEKRYKEMPDSARRVVDKARTLKHGTETIKLEEPNV